MALALGTEISAVHLFFVVLRLNDTSYSNASEEAWQWLSLRGLAKIML